MKHFHRFVLSLFLTLTSVLAFFVYAPTNALATGQWALTGQMNVVHQGVPTAALPLQNGKVVIAGGLNGQASNGVTNVAELYDPSTGQWTQTGNMGLAVAGMTPIV